MSEPDVIRDRTLRVLDGGLASELARRGLDLSDHLWSARLLLDAPDAIAQVHRDYYLAGADVAITASYQASYDGFAQRGLGADETTALLRRSVPLAQTARDQARQRLPEQGRRSLSA